MASIDPRKLVVIGGSKSSAKDQEISEQEEGEGEEEEEEETFTVEAVLDYTTWDRWADTTNPPPEGDRYEVRYRVKWLDYDSTENSWEPQENFSNQEACISFWKACEKSHPERKLHQAVVDDVAEQNEAWKKSREKGKGKASKKSVTKKPVNTKRKRIVKEDSVSSTSSISKKPRRAPPSTASTSTAASAPSQLSQPSTRRRQRGDLVDQAAINDMSRDTKLLRELRFPTPPQHDANGQLIVSGSSEGSSPRAGNYQGSAEERSGRRKRQKVGDRKGNEVDIKASKPSGFAQDSDSMEEDQQVPIPRTIPNRGFADDDAEDEEEEEERNRPNPSGDVKPKPIDSIRSRIDAAVEEGNASGKKIVTGFAGDSDEEEEEGTAQHAPARQLSTSSQAIDRNNHSRDNVDQSTRQTTGHSSTTQATGFARDSDEEDSGHGEAIEPSKVNQGFAGSDEEEAEEEEEREGEGGEQLEEKRSITQETVVKKKGVDGGDRKKEKSKSSGGKAASRNEQSTIGQNDRKRRSDSTTSITSDSKTKKKRRQNANDTLEKKIVQKKSLAQDEDLPAPSGPAHPSVPSQRELLQKLKFGRISKDANAKPVAEDPPRTSHDNRSPSILTNSATDQQSNSRGSGNTKKQEEDPFNHGVQRPVSKDGYITLNHDMLKMKKLPEAICGSEKPNWPIDLHQDQDRIRWWWKIDGNPLVNFANFNRIMQGRKVFVTSPPTAREIGTNKQAAAHEKDYLALQLVLSGIEGVKQADSPRPEVTAVFVHASLMSELGRFPGKLSELDRYRDRDDVVFLFYGTGLDRERALRQFWRPLTAITFTASALLEDTQRLCDLLRTASLSRDTFEGNRNQFPFMLPQYLLRGGNLGSAVDEQGNLEPRSPDGRAIRLSVLKAVFSLLHSGSLSLTAVGPSLDKTYPDQARFPCIFDQTPNDPVFWAKLEDCYPSKFCTVSAERLQKLVCGFRSRYSNIRRWIIVASQAEIDSLAPAPGIILTSLARADEIVSRPLPLIL